MLFTVLAFLCSTLTIIAFFSASVLRSVCLKIWELRGWFIGFSSLVFAFCKVMLNAFL
ncbi:Uncharacterised protein [Streptococcus pneumoniae]|nr:Uncharacterised protein [Streptococcus pneumoniae]CKV04511.1 Uncharacterised protein [Mycobacterium tuberculosis]